MSDDRHDEHELLRNMEEACVLPAGDPLRSEVERVVQRSGPAAQATWAELLEEDRTLRRLLGEIRAPVGLVSRLLSLPDSAAEARRRRRRRSLLTVAAAACVLIMVLAGSALMHRHVESTRITEVAQLAIANFLHDDHVTEVTDDRVDLGGRLSRVLPFTVRLPDLGAEFSLRGGRKCALGPLPVAYASWQGPDGTYALYQMVAADHGVPRDLEARLVEVTCGPDDERCAVVVWSRGDRAYAMVSRDGPGALRALAESLR